MASSTNTLGKYQIIREIARSNDIVYEAIDPSINRRIALKELCIPPNVDGSQRRERIERFQREGHAAGRLNHPNIVTVYEVGQENDRYFIAMEFLEGQTLRDTIQAGGAMSVPRVKEIMLQLCSALSCAHANGVVHRDIKPENVQILPGGFVKLTDFGIARMTTEPSITQNGQVFGTPSYMSPEQVAGKPVDARSDIFSLGVLLYEMLAGQKPFTGDSIVTITYNIMNMEPSPPPGAPPYVTAIIHKAMAKDPDMRFQNVDEIAEDIREEKANGVYVPNGNGVGSIPSPFGGAQHQPGMTPYGTPMSSYGGGSSSSPSGVSAPDPFAQNAQPLPPMVLPAPPKPILSAETRNFLGIFLLVIAFAGMLVFAIWAVNLAYTSYRTAVTGEVASKYMEQGNKLYEQNQWEAAVKQWQNVIRVSPGSKYADQAKKAIFDVSVALARKYYDEKNAASLRAQADSLVQAGREKPEGHFYLGYAYQLSGDTERAKDEYALAVQYGGNDAYAQAARGVLAPIYISDGDRLAAAGQKDQAIAAYEKAKQYGDADTLKLAEERINSIR